MLFEFLAKHKNAKQAPTGYTASKPIYGWVRTGSFESPSDQTADMLFGSVGDVGGERHAYSEKTPLERKAVTRFQRCLSS